MTENFLQPNAFFYHHIQELSGLSRAQQQQQRFVASI